jgi:hypothetical protein
MADKKISFSFFLTTALLLSISLNPSAALAEALPETTIQGLHLVPDTKLGAVYLKEGADFSSYESVYLLDCQVAFRKNWKRDQNRYNSHKVSDKDIAKIKDFLGNECKSVFTSQLIDTGTSIAQSIDNNVLVVRPAIINLDVIAPDTKATRTTSFTTSAGSMTLFLEVFDGVTGDLLAQVTDPQKSRDYGSLRVTNGITNKSDARRILKKWAETLADYLQDARNSSAQPM